MKLEVTESAPHNLKYPYTDRLEPGDTFDVSEEKGAALLERHDYLKEADIVLSEDEYEVLDERPADDPGEDDLSELTKAELYDMATEAGIEGRSSMDKDELIDALED